jgi:uncharacterized membrane protein
VFLSYALGVLIIVLILIRQTRIRPVRRVLTLRLPIILGVIGLLQLFSYTGHHHVSTDDYLWVGGTLLIGAVVMGALRALTVRIWTSHQWVVQQGTTITMVLWAISLAVHFLADAGDGHRGAANLESATLLLYLALTIGVQAYVVNRRSLPLWNELGPDAGRRLQVNFGQGPNAFFGTVFTNFGTTTGGADPAGASPMAYDPNIIDAEVVDDDEGPIELQPPR